MASRDTLQQADQHRTAIRQLTMSQDTDTRQLASAVLDVMAWLDANYTDLQRLFSRVSSLESDVKQINEKLDALLRSLHHH